MKNIINREQPFQVLATNFSIGPSSSGYELADYWNCTVTCHLTEEDEQNDNNEQ